MTLVDKKRLVTLIMPLVLLLSGCNATDHEVAATQHEPPASTSSPTDHIPVEQDWGARHQEEDRVWASRTGLMPEQVRELRLMADAPDDMNAYIDNLDTETLRARNHILLVTASGNGHCLQLAVFEREGDDFELIWSVTGTPDGAGFCRESPNNPEAYATPDGKLVVKVPVFDYSKGAAKATDFYTYIWNGKAYEFAGKSTAA
jgi:hypothetical protein